MGEANNGIRLVIAGGGTGGHVLPALAVVEELRRRSILSAALWIGSDDGIERQAADDNGIRFVAIPTGKLRRYLSLRNLTDAARIPLGLAAARRTLRSYHPHVVFSTGGYVSVPTVIGAWGIAPVLTHEQTAVLGLATRINVRFADVLAISHSPSEREARRLHNNVIVTGNPVRNGLQGGDRERGRSSLGFASKLPIIYVTGGARGASPINQRVAAMLPGLLEQTQVIHQTGSASANDDARKLSKLRSSLPNTLQNRYRIFEYIADVLPDIYAAADLVIGRAGAGTIAELAFVGKPSILIPLPGAGGDEQLMNARVLGEIDAAVVIAQKEATPTRLRSEITLLLADPERLTRMANSAKSAARPDAAARLADALIHLAKSSAATSR